MTGLPTLTLWQPWASLTAIGAKRIETRSWRTSYRGPIAIHAGKTKASADEIGMEPWGPLLDPANPGMLRAEVRPLPLGAIVATARLVDCLPILPEADDYSDGRACIESYAGLLRQWGEDAESFEDISDQLPYGDFTPGRWAWLLEDVQPTTERCPACWGEGLLHDLPLPWPLRGCTIECEREVECGTCGRIKHPIGRSVPLEAAGGYCGVDCPGYSEDPKPGDLWPGELRQAAERDCPVCDGEGYCAPIPAKGKQGLWSFEW